MHLYRLVGEVLITGFDTDRGYEEIEDYHILAVSVLWPEPLDEMQVEAHVMADLLREYEHDHSPAWAWVHGPTVTEITDPALLRAAGVPESLIEEPDHV